MNLNTRNAIAAIADLAEKQPIIVISGINPHAAGHMNLTLHALLKLKMEKRKAFPVFGIYVEQIKSQQEQDEFEGLKNYCQRYHLDISLQFLSRKHEKQRLTESDLPPLEDLTGYVAIPPMVIGEQSSFDFTPGQLYNPLAEWSMDEINHFLLSSIRWEYGSYSYFQLIQAFSGTRLVYPEIHGIQSSKEKPLIWLINREDIKGEQLGIDLFVGDKHIVSAGKDEIEKLTRIADKKAREFCTDVVHDTISATDMARFQALKSGKTEEFLKELVDGEGNLSRWLKHHDAEDVKGAIDLKRRYQQPVS